MGVSQSKFDLLNFLDHPFDTTPRKVLDQYVVFDEGILYSGTCFFEESNIIVMWVPIHLHPCFHHHLPIEGCCLNQLQALTPHKSHQGLLLFPDLVGHHQTQIAQALQQSTTLGVSLNSTSLDPTHHTSLLSFSIICPILSSEC
jgi:hypothetical protein